MAKEIIPKFAEDDDLARAKAFWNENGKSILLTIALSLAGIGGFNYWINYQQEQGEVTSQLYDQVRAATGDRSEMPEINDLKINYSESIYTALATFKLVKLLVEENKLTEARDELEWILGNSADEIILHIARIRLSSLYLALNEPEKVLDLLSAQDNPEFRSRYQELRGDAYAVRAEKGDFNNARAAYALSIESVPNYSGRSGLVQLKLDNLGEN